MRLARRPISIPKSKPIPGETIRAVAVDRTNWRIAYAASEDNVVVTVDGGVTWQRLTPSKRDNGSLPETKIESLTIMPRNKPDLIITDRAGRSANIDLDGALTLG